jgi:uncharacterized OsmC-like protein
MTTRTFHFRLRSRHLPPERATSDLLVDLRTGSGQWEPQPLSFATPGFRIYLLSLLLCQHFYLVANAQERGIPLGQVEGQLVVTTSADWIVTAVEGNFRIHLDPGARDDQRQRADGEAIAAVQERMKLCPVSRNLSAGVHKRIDLSVAPA